MLSFFQRIKPSILKADTVLYLIIFIGIVLRIMFYMDNRPFWLDECALLLNIINKNNFFYNLEWAQTSPAFFLYVSKFIYSIFPDNQFAMRFLPLLFSIGSIFAFLKLTKTFLKKPAAIIIAVTMFSFILPLINYAQEFKQYSGDVLFFILILLTYPYIEQINSKKAVFLWGIFYGLMFYVSYAAFFAEFGIFATLLLYNPKQFKKIFLILVPIIYSAVMFYICTSCNCDMDFLKRFWSTGFLTEDIYYDYTIIKDFFNYLFQNWYILIIFGFSLLLTIKNDYKDRNMSLLLSPFLCVLLLSYMRIYPLHTRVCLFLCPVIIIFTLKWIDYINIKNKIIYSIILVVFTVFAIKPNIISDYKTVFKKEYLYEDIRTPLLKAIEMAEENDIFIISYYNVWLYEYTEHIIPVKNPTIVEGLDTPTESYINKLESYPSGRTYFWIESHHNHDERFDLVNEWAKQKEDYFCQSDAYNNAIIRYRLE